LLQYLVPVRNHSDVENAIPKLESYTFPVSNEIPAKLIQAGCETLLSAIQKHFHSVWNKDELSHNWKEPVIAPVHETGYQLHTFSPDYIYA
jgi:hypothetical protein